MESFSDCPSHNWPPLNSFDLNPGNFYIPWSRLAAYMGPEISQHCRWRDLDQILEKIGGWLYNIVVEISVILGLNGVAVDRYGLILGQNGATGSRKGLECLLGFRDTILGPKLTKKTPKFKNPGKFRFSYR